MTDRLNDPAFMHRHHIQMHMLTSLARSQRALTQMLEAVAELTQKSADAHINAEMITTNPKETVQRVVDNIQQISNYQRQLTAKITGIAIHRRVRVRGHNGKPWLNHEYVTELREGTQEKS
ncbi:hypothetical protein [Paenibacillus periandrae]|uniref:hypothetical protein n=1 Tax=Paenibacillus periandrae TaxID=1761741 RepID=UPI001F09D9AC|nr:hypothetical protein [Paenibacillus periandrae]